MKKKLKLKKKIEWIGVLAHTKKNAEKRVINIKKFKIIFFVGNYLTILPIDHLIIMFCVRVGF